MLWQQKAKNAIFQLTRRWNLGINVRDRDLLLVSLYLRFAFRVCIFVLFVILAGPHFVMSHFLISMKSILFSVGSSAFEISTKLVVIGAQ